MNRQAMIDRIERLSMPEPNSGCWLWLGDANAKGYGRTEIMHRPYRAHRLSYEVHKGLIPPGMLVMHKCDVRCCVNPDHLRLGTSAENSADMVAKNRQTRGELNPMAKLNDAAVADIRSSNLRPKELAAKYGIRPSHVTRVRHRERWGHVADKREMA